jgi:hypothetical protein
MAALYLIGQDGQSYAHIELYVQLPKEFVVPKGSMLSLESYFSGRESKPKVMTFGKAKAFFNQHKEGVTVRIESPNADDLFKLRDLVVLHLGGEIIPLGPPADSQIPSIADIIKNEWRKIKNAFLAFITRLKQKLGMKIAVL